MTKKRLQRDRKGLFPPEKDLPEGGVGRASGRVRLAGTSFVQPGPEASEPSIYGQVS